MWDTLGLREITTCSQPHMWDTLGLQEITTCSQPHMWDTLGLQEITMCSQPHVWDTLGLREITICTNLTQSWCRMEMISGKTLVSRDCCRQTGNEAGGMLCRAREEDAITCASEATGS